MMRPRSLAIGLFVVVFMYCCIQIVQGPEYFIPSVLATHPIGGDFVGSETCLECHKDIFDSHEQTAHYNTSAVASRHNILGSFRSGSNRISIGDMEVTMKRTKKGFFQEIQQGGLGVKVDPIDIVVGSGIKGQSYLTWDGDQLFQLQASYYPPSDQWINSPGYPEEILRRPIRDGCLKCHVTFATNKDFSGQGNRYVQDGMIYGIDCERCHRPARLHVEFHRKHPDVAESRYMIKLDTLPHQGRLDLCAQCHSGPRDRLLQGNSFSYLAGEKLDAYSRNFYRGPTDSTLDVHGNQYGLLTSSMCFQKSIDMDCGSCHDPHKNQRGDATSFVEACLVCHQDQHRCTADPTDLHSMGDNCVTCHMPNSPSRAMSVQLADELEPVYIRTHLIGIYPRERWMEEDL